MDQSPQTFSCRAGDTLHIPVANTNPDGTPLDLTGATIRFYLSRRPGGLVVVGTELSPANATGQIDGTATEGNSRAIIAKAVTATLLGTYYWEHVVEDAVGNVVNTARGYVTVRPTNS